ncbi:holo-[acyl-carrier-protein] synthase [bacterium MnTg03]|nr:holo-[acyl-carrier-protein] synthase [bacterium MnTg03]
MIVGVGVDIAETKRFENLYSRYGERIVRRILTESEQVEFGRRNNPASYLATRFAAKEAAAKALGTGFGCGVSYKSIEIKNNNQGKPMLKFINSALELARQKQVENVFVSLSDEKHYVVAMVILER